jgi:hypothetical protein
MLKEVVGTCSTSVGDVVVCQVKEPYTNGDLPWERAYAAVIKQPNEAYLGHPVAMIVTVFDYRDVVEEPIEKVDSWVAAKALTIHNVFRDDFFKGSNNQVERPAVQVGKYLFEHGRFAKHSATRTTRGDSWAKSVGGEVPEREDFDDTEGILKYSRTALGRLQDDSWWHAVSSSSH